MAVGTESGLRSASRKMTDSMISSFVQYHPKVFGSFYISLGSQILKQNQVHSHNRSPREKVGGSS